MMYKNMKKNKNDKMPITAIEMITIFYIRALSMYEKKSKRLCNKIIEKQFSP